MYRSTRMDQSENLAGSTSRRTWSRIAIGLLFASVFFAGIFFFRESLSLENLVEREDNLRQFQQDHPWLAVVIAFVIYVVITGFSIPGAAALSLVLAWYFGFWTALPLISFASTLGATIAFLSSRYVIGSVIQRKFGSRLQTFNSALERDGPYYLFTLRLIPAVPFFVINVVMGLTRIRTWTFWWVSQLGMLPGTIVYVFAGSSIGSLRELSGSGLQGIVNWQTWCAFALLAVFPVLVRYAARSLCSNAAN
ncbi:MAG: TVP38/TMEM64 family protein [Pirellulaceae bacterium]